MPIPPGLAHTRRAPTPHGRGTPVVHVAPEFTPLAKVGGLADAVAGLAAAQGRAGLDVTVILPGHRVLLEGGWECRREPAGAVGIRFGETTRRAEPVRILLPGFPGRILALDLGEGFDREGIYTDPGTGAAFPDNPDRFARFCLGALSLLERIDLKPRILHLHDHPAAWAAPLLRRRPGTFYAGTRVVLSLHNPAHQGLAEPELLDRLGIDRAEFTAGGTFEFWGKVNPLKAGIVEADAVATVSAAFARDLVSGPEIGFGLDGVLRARGDSLSGILNGIDTAVWNPATDPHLASRYGPDRLEARGKNRRALAAEFGFEEPGLPVVGMVSRLDGQKGVDLVCAGMDALLERGLNLVVLGAGELRFQRFFAELAERRRGRVGYRREFDDPLAHRIQGGADLLLVPSRFEPCGLTQMIAMRYGAVPLVRRTGGLAETVGEGPEGTGFLFEEYRVEALLETVDRALSGLGDAAGWRALQRRGMARDSSWSRPETAYRAVYERLAGPLRCAPAGD